jgi:hypothetical protein
VSDQPRLNTPATGEPADKSGSDDAELDDFDDLSVTALEPERASSFRPASVSGPLRRVWRASGVIALIGLVAIVAVALGPHLPRPAQPRATIPYLALGVSSDVARCLSGETWSHDGRQIAAVGSSTCGAPYIGQGQSDTQPNLLIFDAATGRKVATYLLDPAVRTALAQIGLKVNGASVYDISYFETNWSPDGRLMEVGFGVYGEQASDVGVAVVTLTGAARGHISVWLDSANAVNALPANGFDAAPVERWDLTNGSQTTIYLSPALAYRWLPSDVLVADEPLPVAGSAPAEPAAAALGDPIGGQSFTLWRTGTLSLINALSCGTGAAGVQPLSAPYAYLSLDSTVWSPDGRYLLYASVAAQAGIQSPSHAPTQTPIPTEPGVATFYDLNPCDSGPPPDQLPKAPIHDKGLQSALMLLDLSGDNQLSLAWSADGQRLAVATFTPSQGTGALIVYDCATGAVLQQLTGDQFEGAASAIDLAQDPVWSPDSSQLLLSVSGPDAKLVVVARQNLGG